MTLSAVVERIARKSRLEPDFVEDAYPCTSHQAGLLATSFHGVADNTSTFAFELSPKLHDPASIKAAFEVLYDQTPILRTRFFETRGAFWQVVVRTPVLWLEYGDLASYLEFDSEEKLGFGRDLARFAWIGNDNGKSYIVWTMHHASCDEWSLNLLFDDFSRVVLYSTDVADRPPRRPAFSKFIKALTEIDKHASRSFWTKRLANLDQCCPICADVDVSLRTSDQLEVSGPFTASESGYHQSTIVLGAWALMISHLTDTNTVVFGNIIDGRALDLPGIIDMNGPTTTIVPCVIKIPFGETIHVFMTDLERMRSEMLPFEQTGLEEYRKMSGDTGFDTLVNIRSSPLVDKDMNDGQLRPRMVGKRDHSHPCCLLVDASFEAGECLLKASFDARWIDENHLRTALEKVISCLRDLSHDTQRNLQDLVDSLEWPASIRRQEIQGTHKLDSLDSEGVFPIDSQILEKVLQVFQDLGPLQDSNSVQLDTSLKEMGLDSLQKMVIARRLSDAFQVSVPFKNIANLRTTISDVAKLMQTTVKGNEPSPKVDKISLSQKAEKHAESFQAADDSLAVSDGLKSILLTGATGYLGIEILRQCLSFSKESIILPVRCETAEEGFDRLQRSAVMAKWQPSELAMLKDRIRIWPSDLSNVGLGLDSQQLSEIKNVGAIIHNGARVDFLLDYHDLETTNVESTAFLLSQHMRSAMRPSFVYVTGGRSCPLEAETDIEAVESRLAGATGYAQTKFTSELLLQHAQDVCNNNEREAKMTIVHPGIVIGNETSGVANTDDFIWRYVSASVRMRAYVPVVPTEREWVNLTSIDKVASATVSAMATTHGLSEVERHLVLSGMTVARFWEIVIENLGEDAIGLEPVSEGEWLRRLEEDLDKQGVKHPLFSLSQLLTQGHAKGIGGLGPRSKEELSARDVPSAERALIANVKYLKDIGFFAREAGERRAVDVFERNKY